MTDQKTNQLSFILRTVCLLILVHCRHLMSTMYSSKQCQAGIYFDFISSTFQPYGFLGPHFVNTVTQSQSLTKVRPICVV
jgi:hypothetical protein